MLKKGVYMKVGMINGLHGISSVKNNQSRSFKGAPLINGAGGVIIENASSWVSASTVEPTLKATAVSAIKGGLLTKIAACTGVLALLALGAFLAKRYDDINNAYEDNDTSVADAYLMQESMFG